jgi:hypothetical protein
MTRSARWWIITPISDVALVALDCFIAATPSMMDAACLSFLTTTWDEDITRN